MTTTLWINKLSHHALKAINYDSQLSKVSRVKYIEASGNPDLILESFSGEGKLGSISEKAEVHLGDKRTQDGQILLVKAVFLLEELVGRIADSMWINNDLSHFWPSQVSIPRVRNYLERCIEEADDLHLMAAERFCYSRSSDLNRLLGQVRNRHYSTFSLYGEKALEAAIETFRENISRDFNDPRHIEWQDENIMYQIGKTRP